MSGFKLLAIRPLKGCDSEYRKVLKEGVLYKFYNDYNFTFEDSKKLHSNVIDVKSTIKTPENLYEIERKNIDNLKVNISAVVGENGSGKSTLIELFHIAIYLISVQKGKLRNVNYYDKEIEKISNSIKLKLTDKKDRIIQLKFSKKQLIQFQDKIKLELYYSVENTVFQVIINNSNQETVKNKSFKSINIYDPLKLKQLKLNDFFYSISLNYSVYGLNSKIVGNWIETLFHKNDGYQTPLVINPMRTVGNYDINVESHLSQTRILINLIDDDFEIKELVNEKEIIGIEFELEDKKIEELFGINFKNIVSKFEKLNNTTLNEAFNFIYMTILDEKMIPQNIIHFDKIKLYALKKVFKIAAIYREYNKFYHVPVNGSPIPELVDFKKYIIELKKDKSHKTYKLRQILNTVKYDLLRENNTNKWKKNKFYLEIDEFISRMKKLNLGKKNYEIIEYIPAAFFNPRIRVINNSKFEQLSSGELQMVNTLQTIYYHLINLNSIFNTEENSKGLQTKYNSINIILDEIELYFHPEFQRRFIYELMSGLKKMKLNNISKINLIFCTHSPFILSDIPISNILRLKSGKIDKIKNIEQTFGANINNLLHDNFFLKNTLIGKFAEEKITSYIQHSHSKIAPTHDSDIIEIIGDSFLKSSIKNYLKNHDQN